MNHEMSDNEKLFYEAFGKQYPQYKLEPQKNVCNFFVDFGIEGRFFVVEIDNKDSHTSEVQRMADYQRERTLILNRYFPIRFTAKEVANDPDRCAYDLYRILERYPK